jgi:pimeloyl-ACP methyl ester carboxylesterase
LIAVSFPGHGDSTYYSDSPAKLSIATLGQLTASVVRQFNPKNYLLIGQSLGGHALLEALHLHPGAKGLCLISAPPFAPDTISSVFREDPTGGLLFANELSTIEIEQFATAFVERNNLSVKNQLARHIHMTNGQFRADLGNSLAQGLLEDEISALATARIPTLLLQAKQDQFIHNDYYNSLRLLSLPLEIIEFENCGHAIQLDAPEEFQVTVTNFINKYLGQANAAQLNMLEEDAQHA